MSTSKSATVIIVTWQLIVTLDSIRNSCDVYMQILLFMIMIYDMIPDLKW